MAIGKSLGAGVPIAAALFSERVAGAAAFGDHGSTYGGNLLACRAALVFLDELESGGLMAHVARLGAHMEAELRRLQTRHPMIREVRGAGLMWGLDLDRPAAPVVDAAIQQALLVNRTAETVVRLLPPYIITAEEVDEGIALLDAALIAAFGGQER
jgi:acetylornithine/succinyldiaminopimelate/putrescine aminotransferase